MEQFDINIATFNYYNKRIAKWIFLCLSVIIVFTLVMNLKLYFEKKTIIKAYQTKIEGMTSEITGMNKVEKKRRKDLSDTEKKVLRSQAAHINKIMLRDVFPWPDALDCIEKKVPVGVVLESVIYSGTPFEILLKGNASSTGVVDRFLDGLNADERFKKNVLSILSIGPKDSTGYIGDVSVSFEISSWLAIQAFLPGAHFTND